MFEINQKLTATASDLSLQIARAVEISICEQLKWLVDRDLLVIERGPHWFAQNPIDGTISFQQKVALKLKDKEYIEKLETENARLKGLIEELQECLK